jgi:hypothetical protein
MLPQAFFYAPPVSLHGPSPRLPPIFLHALKYRELTIFSFPADVFSLGLVFFEIFEKKLPGYDPIRLSVILPPQFAVRIGEREEGQKRWSGRREPGRSMEGALREPGRSIAGAWREPGGRLEGDWREIGGRLEGDWREIGGRLKGIGGVWRVWRRLRKVWEVERRKAREL